MKILHPKNVHKPKIKKQQIHSPERPVLNTDNEGIKKAIELISFENLTPEERTQAKNKEATRVTIAKIENRKVFEIAKKAIKKGFDNQTIVDLTDLTIEQIEQLRSEKE